MTKSKIILIGLLLFVSFSGCLEEREILTIQHHYPYFSSITIGFFPERPYTKPCNVILEYQYADQPSFFEILTPKQGSHIHTIFDENTGRYITTESLDPFEFSGRKVRVFSVEIINVEIIKNEKIAICNYEIDSTTQNLVRGYYQCSIGTPQPLFESTKLPCQPIVSFEVPSDVRGGF